MKPDIPGYTIVAQLGRSSMSTVYRAVQIALDRTVLIKAMRTSFKQQHSMAKRFLREAKTCARLAHPNIIQVYDFGARNDAPYIIMEYVQGRSLRQMLQEKGLFSVDEAIHIIREVLHGLSYAHGRGVLHRDIKPDNIMIADDDKIKITDFGLATLMHETESIDPGATVGTPAYMSPEQVRGEKVDQRSDVFSAGVVFYELLTGRSPFAGDTIEESIHHVMNTEPGFSSSAFLDIPDQVQNICRKMLAKDSSQRYAGADAVLSALDATPLTSNENAAPKAMAPATASRKLWLFLVPAVLFMVAISFWLRRASHGESPGGSDRSVPLENPAMLQSDNLSTQASLAQDSVHVLRDTSRRTPVKEIVEEKKAKEKPSPVEPGAGEIIREPEQPAIGWASIDIQPWAEVHLDNASYGMTPVESAIQLQPGEHVIRLNNPAFGEFQDTIKVAAGDTLHYKFNFNKVFGRLRLDVMPWAEIYIDDKFRGASPLSQPLHLKPGLHHIRLVNPAFGLWQRSIQIKPGEELVIQAKLSK